MALLRIGLLLFAVATATIADDINQRSAEPEYLDMLLEEERYEEFAKLMKIDSVDLVRPSSAETKANPMFNKGLKRGDILLTPKQTEQARQGLRLTEYPESKWEYGIVPYRVSRKFRTKYRLFIEDMIDKWNNDVQCVQWVPRTDEKDYVLFFNGDGCYSHLGRTGGQQPICLQQNGCMSESTVHHEMDHAIGFDHEQTRPDRDDYIKILWDNIPEDWKSQYEKGDPEVFDLNGPYDYYSVMHYSVIAPDTDNKPAFEILEPGIDESKVGNGEGLTDTDLEKISDLYCDDYY